jgi:hypothetical protein
MRSKERRIRSLDLFLGSLCVAKRQQEDNKAFDIKKENPPFGRNKAKLFALYRFAIKEQRSRDPFICSFYHF